MTTYKCNKERILRNIKDEWCERLQSYCWAWQLMTRNGYGALHYKDKLVIVHRFSYETFIGPIPTELNVLHRCDVRSCCNPEHLFLGTQKDNMQDMVSKDRQDYVNGERHGEHKLFEPQVIEIITKYSTGNYTSRQLGKEYGVSKTQIMRIVKGNSWKHIIQRDPISISIGSL